MKTNIEAFSKLQSVSNITYHENYGGVTNVYKLITYKHY